MHGKGTIQRRFWKYRLIKPGCNHLKEGKDVHGWRKNQVYGRRYGLDMKCPPKFHVLKDADSINDLIH
jgi:hypothetical protein